MQTLDAPHPIQRDVLPGCVLASRYWAWNAAGLVGNDPLTACRRPSPASDRPPREQGTRGRSSGAGRRTVGRTGSSYVAAWAERAYRRSREASISSRGRRQQQRYASVTTYRTAATEGRLWRGPFSDQPSRAGWIRGVARLRPRASTAKCAAALVAATCDRLPSIHYLRGELGRARRRDRLGRHELVRLLQGAPRSTDWAAPGCCGMSPVASSSACTLTGL